MNFEKDKYIALGYHYKYTVYYNIKKNVFLLADPEDEIITFRKSSKKTKVWIFCRERGIKRNNFSIEKIY